jgi:hypothetical protein
VGERRTLQVPIGRAVPADVDWAVFVVEGDVARERIVTLGQRGARQAEILDGLTEGDMIVTHPSDAVADGVTIVDRSALYAGGERSSENRSDPRCRKTRRRDLSKDLVLRSEAGPVARGIKLIAMARLAWFFRSRPHLGTPEILEMRRHALRLIGTGWLEKKVAIWFAMRTSFSGDIAGALRDAVGVTEDLDLCAAREGGKRDARASARRSAWAVGAETETMVPTHRHRGLLDDIDGHTAGHDKSALGRRTPSRASAPISLSKAL